MYFLIDKGIGFGQLYATALAISYYASVLAIIIKYLIDSFSSTLPFCNVEWGTENVVNASDKLSNFTSAMNFSRYKSSAELYF